MATCNVFRLSMVREKTLTYSPVSTYHDAAAVGAALLADAPAERVAVMFLDVKGSVIGTSILFAGRLSESLLSAREVFQAALVANAASIILAHNHPSGDPTPSPEDIAVTKHLAEAGNLIGIDVLDHIIIGHDKTLSLKREGHIGA